VTIEVYGRGGVSRRDIVGLLLAHYARPHTKFLTVPTVCSRRNDEWLISSRYMMVEAFADINKEEIDPILSITTKAA
jgi:hypothetical protein